MKQITTGTEITFKKTKEIFELTQTDTGFDVRQAKFSKNVQPEHWTFQELLDQYEAGKITIEGFEETDASHVRAILTGYIHQTVVKAQIIKITELTAKNDELTAINEELTALNDELTAINDELTALNDELTARNEELTTMTKTLEEEIQEKTEN